MIILTLHLFICILLESQILNRLLSTCREMRCNHFSFRNWKYAMLRLFLLSFNSKYNVQGVWQVSTVYNTNNPITHLLWLFSKEHFRNDWFLFFSMKDVIWEKANNKKFLITISFFLSHFVSTDLPEGNCKSNIWFSIMRSKITYRLYSLAKSPDKFCDSQV